MSEVFTRVDERLIHLQITRKWMDAVKCSCILVVDDESYNDMLATSILKLSVPEETAMHIMTAEQGAEFLLAANTGERIFLLVKKLQTIGELIQKSVPVRRVNLGQVPAGKGRKRFHGSIFLSADEKNLLRQWIDNGMEIVVQMVPDEEPLLITEEML